MNHAARLRFALMPFKLLVFLTLAAPYACFAQPAANDPKLEQALQSIINRHGGKVAVEIRHLKNGRQFAHQADEPMPTASLIKLPILIEAYRQVADGRLQLDKRLTLKQEDKVPGSGILTDRFSAGTEISLYDALHLMIVYSDNTATNLVIDQIGLPATTKAMAELGCPNTQLNAKVFRRDTSIALQRSRTFGLGSTTAAEMVSLLSRLDAGQLVDPDSSTAILKHLYACDDRSKIPSQLPPGTKVAHKTGAVARSRCDAGLIDSPSGRIAICILTTDNEDQSWTDENEANVLCGQLARAAFDVLNPDFTPDDATPELAIGVQGGLVETLQRTLMARVPGLDIGVDGDFGPRTEAAVMQFQRSAKLKAHGRVDKATWAALSPLIEQGPEPPAPELVNQQQLPVEPADSLAGPPFVSCRAWAIMDVESGELLFTDNAWLPLDMASTTKIMTAVVALQMAKQDPTLLDQDVVFTKRADETEGSTAGLRAGEIVSLRHLLYGLMLPSGNDASVAIGEHLGAILLSRDDANSADVKKRDPLPRFVQSMNETAANLALTASSFQNTHGLTAEGHQTSAQDLAKLTRHALALPHFRELVSRRQYGTAVRSRQGYTRNVVWKNTNRLLGTEGYAGVKTGTTQAAGACLVSLAQRDGRELIAVTLGASSSAGRYVDTRNLLRWAWGQLTSSTTSGVKSATAADSSQAVVQKKRTGPVVISQQARDIHQRALLIDGHNDLPWRYRERGMPSFEAVDIAKLQPEMHTDIPRLREGGVKAQFWSVYVPVSTADDGKALLTTLEQIQFVHAMIKQYPDVFQLALTHDEVLEAIEQGKIASLIGVEGGHSIENSLNVLRQLYEQGARYMTLTHSSTLDWADSATDTARHQGLTAFGEEVIREMNRLGMLVDLSHVSPETMKHALRITRAPVIFSHSSARAIADHPRNVPDDVLKLVAKNGGVVMVNFYSSFVVPASAARSVERTKEQNRLKAEGLPEDEVSRRIKVWELQHPVDIGSIYDVVDHIDHIVKVAGVEHVGIGSDYDGIDLVPKQLEDVATYPRITQELLNRGYQADAIEKILGRNVLRVMKEAESVAAELTAAQP